MWNDIHWTLKKFWFCDSIYCTRLTKYLLFKLDCKIGTTTAPGGRCTLCQKGTYGYMCGSYCFCDQTQRYIFLFKVENKHWDLQNLTFIEPLFSFYCMAPNEYRFSQQLLISNPCNFKTSPSEISGWCVDRSNKIRLHTVELVSNGFKSIIKSNLKSIVNNNSEKVCQLRLMS